MVAKLPYINNNNKTTTHITEGINMKTENKIMKNYLAQNGIKARVKHLDKGSLAGTWRLYNPDLRWTEEIAEKLEDLGFRDFDGKHFNRFSGNGGIFSVFARKL